MDDIISRQTALDVLHGNFDGMLETDTVCPKDLYNEFEALPSAQPNLDEWCRDCKEYDKERHSCPRWNRVIRHTVEDLKAEAPERKKGKWIDKSGGIEGAWNYCSVCGEQAIDLYDFCPNCGADMRGNKGD